MKNFIIILLLSLVLLFSCFNPMIDTEDNSPNVFVHVSGLSEGYRLGIEAYDSFGIVNVSSGEDFYLDKGEYTIFFTLFKGASTSDSENSVITSRDIEYLHKGIDETLYIEIVDNSELFVYQFEIADETLYPDGF